MKTIKKVGAVKQGEDYKQCQEQVKLEIYKELGMKTVVRKIGEKYPPITQDEIDEKLDPKGEDEDIEIESCDLQKWGHEVPYGVLLKIKEAKDVGYDNFTIHYPEKNNRKKSDPIVTSTVPTNEKLSCMCKKKTWCSDGYECWNCRHGGYRTEMHLIAHWDDGKIYG